MNPIQEAKQELEASIRYAENAISSAKKTIESMATYQEQTGREEALTKQVQDLEREVQRQKDIGQGYYDDMMTFKSQIALLEERIADTQSDMVGDASTIKTLKEEREMLEKNVKYLRDENERLKQDKPTMPVIPKDVAIAIFREGIATGVLSACSELEGQTINVCENEYCGDFEVTFARDIHLDDELDLDWMRDKCAAYTDDAVIDSLQGLCADNNFECRIHGIDDQEEKKND